MIPNLRQPYAGIRDAKTTQLASKNREVSYNTNLKRIGTIISGRDGKIRHADPFFHNTLTRTNHDEVGDTDTATAIYGAVFPGTVNLSRRVRIRP
jgi:hypothetical protein